MNTRIQEAEMKSTEYLIIGNGGSGVNAAKKISEIDQNADITIVSSDSNIMYYRPKLIHFLAGENSAESLVMFKADWYEKRGIKNILGRTVISIDPAGHNVTLDDGNNLSYDRLLLAVGAYSFKPPIKGSDNDGVFTLRTLEDAEKILERINGKSSAVVIGGGLLGLETGHALIKQGLSVHVIEFFPRLLPRQMDEAGAGVLQASLEKKGFTFHLGKVTETIEPVENDELRVVMKDSTVCQGGAVVISAGIRCNLELAANAGIKVDKGILVDSRMKTSAEDVYAAGDCVQFDQALYGIWPACLDHAGIAGSNMAGKEVDYTGTVLSTQLKIAGIDLVSTGEIDADNKLESKIHIGEDTYRKEVYRDNVLVGFILFGDISDARNLKSRLGKK
ncbi:MAG: NAD(P)/FAD-dependent oxidoreductase [Candidatus Wallbacteria bacterium HGW-Wallbacteria-1]|uniref:NAD(P)/FAD-dependent oxidoreductase n=1 Tax=Candidatus Wallbacteria bacterium HGW-Wallbacteria-1 TaxID=2013854 RepID=A0A2N1PME5_9BACT|nr:MAG: NAD(P)/FAD-dependent oxidoreductase [Candidatus Wallbacteria bacterium HGW-Wallbacteria-1]